MKRAIVPAAARDSAAALKMSPAIWANGFVFLTGVTGSLPDGAMPTQSEAQIRSAFDKIGQVLAEAGLGFDAVVEMTSYHVGLRGHFELFDRVRLDYVAPPYPAWTAVEVAGLRREGAIVEIRVIAAAGPGG